MAKLEVYDSNGRQRHPPDGEKQSSKISNDWAAKRYLTIDASGDEAALICYVEASTESVQEQLYLVYRGGTPATVLREFSSAVQRELIDGRDWQILDLGEPRHKLFHAIADESSSGASIYGDDFEMMAEFGEQIVYSVPSYRHAVSVLRSVSLAGRVVTVAKDEENLGDPDIGIFLDPTQSEPVELTPETKQRAERVRDQYRTRELHRSIKSYRDHASTDGLVDALNSQILPNLGVSPRLDAPRERGQASGGNVAEGHDETKRRFSLGHALSLVGGLAVGVALGALHETVLGVLGDAGAAAGAAADFLLTESVPIPVVGPLPLWAVALAAVAFVAVVMVVVEFVVGNDGAGGLLGGLRTRLSPGTQSKVELTAPTEGAKMSTASIEVAGTATDDEVTLVLEKGTRTIETTKSSASDGQFSGELVADFDGEHTVVARDSKGAKDSVTFEISATENGPNGRRDREQSNAAWKM